MKQFDALGGKSQEELGLTDTDIKKLVFGEDAENMAIGVPLSVDAGPLQKLLRDGNIRAERVGNYFRIEERRIDNQGSTKRVQLWSYNHTSGGTIDIPNVGFNTSEILNASERDDLYTVHIEYENGLPTMQLIHTHVDSRTPVSDIEDVEDLELGLDPLQIEEYVTGTTIGAIPGVSDIYDTLSDVYMLRYPLGLTQIENLKQKMQTNSYVHPEWIQINDRFYELVLSADASGKLYPTLRQFPENYVSGMVMSDEFNEGITLGFEKNTQKLKLYDKSGLMIIDESIANKMPNDEGNIILEYQTKGINPIEYIFTIKKLGGTGLVEVYKTIIYPKVLETVEVGQGIEPGRKANDVNYATVELYPPSASGDEVLSVSIPENKRQLLVYLLQPGNSIKDLEFEREGQKMMLELSSIIDAQGRVSIQISIYLPQEETQEIIQENLNEIEVVRKLPHSDQEIKIVSLNSEIISNFGLERSLSAEQRRAYDNLYLEKDPLYIGQRNPLRSQYTQFEITYRDDTNITHAIGKPIGKGFDTPLYSFFLDDLTANDYRADLSSNRKVNINGKQVDMVEHVYEYTGPSELYDREDWTVQLRFTSQYDSRGNFKGYIIQVKLIAVGPSLKPDYELTGSDIEEAYNKIKEGIILGVRREAKIPADEAPRLDRGEMGAENLQVMKYDKKVYPIGSTDARHLADFQLYWSEDDKVFRLYYDTNGWIPDIFSDELLLYEFDNNDLVDGKKYVIDGYGDDGYVQLKWNQEGGALQAFLKIPSELQEKEEQENPDEIEVWHDDFIWPLGEGMPYIDGPGRDYLDPRDYDKDGVKDEQHTGIDLAYDKAPVYAADTGRIIGIKYGDGTNQSLTYVFIEHECSNGLKYVTGYKHLVVTPGLKVGDIITQGTTIGSTSDLGSPNAEHLHFDTLVQLKDADGKELSTYPDPGGNFPFLKGYGYINPFGFFEKGVSGVEFNGGKESESIEIDAKYLPIMPGSPNKYLWPDTFVQDQNKYHSSSQSFDAILNKGVYPPQYTVQKFHSDLESYLGVNRDILTTPEHLDTPAKVEAFVDKTLPFVLALSEKYSLLPSVFYGSILNESGYFRNNDYRTTHNNNCGMKVGSWRGPAHKTQTEEEYTPGTDTVISDHFRSYIGFEHSAIDRYLRNAVRVRSVNPSLEDSPRSQLRKIKASGYATDSKYVETTLSVINKYNLTQYDQLIEKGGEPVVEESANAINQPEQMNQLSEMLEFEIDDTIGPWNTEYEVSKYQNSLGDWSGKPYPNARIVESRGNFTLYYSKYKNGIKLPFTSLDFLEPTSGTVAAGKSRYRILEDNGDPVKITIDGKEFRVGIEYSKQGDGSWSMQFLLNGNKEGPVMPDPPENLDADDALSKSPNTKIDVPNGLRTSPNIFAGFDVGETEVLQFNNTMVQASRDPSSLTVSEVDSMRIGLGQDGYLYIISPDKSMQKINPSDITTSGSGISKVKYRLGSKEFKIQPRVKNGILTIRLKSEDA